ncbi:MAG: penicillin acylase family protein [Thermoleophilaceae bacterium]
MTRTRLLAAAVGAMAALASAGAAQARTDFAQTALNVLAPGQYGGLPTNAHSLDQNPLYDGLAPLFGNVTASDLRRFFKPETFGTKGQGPARVERTGDKRVRVVRDRWGVPHVTAKKRADVMYGAGWTMAEDRRLLLDLGRGAGALTVLDPPGINAFGLVTSGRTFIPSAQADSIVNREVAVAKRAGPKGRLLLKDMHAYLRGVNGWYATQHPRPQPFTFTDLIGATGFIGSLFGRGGGDEVRRSEFLDALDKQMGGARGTQLFDDLSENDDPEAQVSIAGRTFPYNKPPANPTGNAIVDDGSFQPSLKVPGVNARAALPGDMSNFLLVSRQRSSTHHPIFVGGPQLGYSYPEVVAEQDLHGGGIDARGAVSPGAGPYVFIGRGRNYSWTLTSANNDIVDQFVETLCGGSDFKYMYKGRCRDMGFVNAGVLKGAGGGPDQTISFHTTVHGPVAGYATVGGVRVAVANDRSTRGRELLSVLAFQDLDSHKIHSARDFLRAIPQLEHTFNVAYADDRDIAMYSAGRLPLRASGVDPRLPTKGTGQFEWRGFLPGKKHPRVIDPKGGSIVNWNTDPAHGFGAADNQWDHGSLDRGEMLAAGLAKRRVHTPASVVAAMNVAATQDYRAAFVLNSVIPVLQGGPAPNPRDQQMLDLLQQWRSNGASRLDRDLDGKIDSPGAAIIDAWFPGLANAVMSSVLGPLTDRFAAIVRRDDFPRPLGSSFDNGWYDYIDKDLRTLLGRPVKGQFHERFCGNGDLATCRAALWSSLDAAGNTLAASQGPDPAAWRSDATAERINFLPGLIPNTIRWVNRPTFQQVVSYNGHPRR